MDTLILELDSINKQLQYLLKRYLVQRKKIRYIKRCISRINKKARSKNKIILTLRIGYDRIQSEIYHIQKQIIDLQKNQQRVKRDLADLSNQEKFNKYWEYHFGKICIEHILDRYDKYEAAA